ncbi:uncharacterized protein TRIVIDRAFT_66217 [Trichoderma virens Gv29-8]|uniref:Uncharacterized protein n=1 Tax=Hypocrea virens (strain Gv29-8 / FGSC 10586) TaxID=413071 RepID=G9N8G6_HYPVG|nr:uncharacterized protein TRIVIDRAFT_66217 [Trichoderma virens Gv29-8]EHK17274.1 hypothetical protein TRIVIDRAFT_66217 [Trichoderma virens Gv29-8]
MDTAIYTSIARAAVLGDGFWQMNTRDAAAFGSAAMSSNQGRSQDQYQNPNQYHSRNQYQGPSQYQSSSQYQYQNHNQYQNPSQLANQSSTAGSTPVMVPPTLASSATQVKSEQDCFELLALEFASLPDREMPPEVSDPVAGQQQQQLTKPSSATAMPDHRITPNTPTNNFVAKTIRAAMADIKPSS